MGSKVFSPVGPVTKSHSIVFLTREQRKRTWKGSVAAILPASFKIY